MLNSTLIDSSKRVDNTVHTCFPLSAAPVDYDAPYMSSPSTWTIAQVEQWLEKNQFHDYIDVLCRRCQFDGQHLINLNEGEILSLTKNTQLWSRIKALQNSKQQSITIQLEPIVLHSYTAGDQIEDQLIVNCCLITSIRSDRRKTLVAFLLVLITVFFCALTITMVDERLPDPKTFPPLPDLILENIEQIPWAFAVTEKIIVLEMATLITVLLLHRHRMIILRRLFTIVAALYFLRSLTMLCTSLPVATQVTDCQPRKLVNFAARLRKATMIFLGQGMSSFGVKTCGDYLYSGHTCTLVLAAHFINEYTPQSYRLLHFLSWVTALTGMFFILAGHQHYSIDILIAWVLSSRLFVYYHTLANNRTFLQHDKSRMRLWFPFFSYFEENVKTAIPNEYCLPKCLSDARATLYNYTDTIRYIVYWLILFVFIVITYNLSFSKKTSLFTLVER